MRAMVLEEQAPAAERPLQLREIDTPEPGAGEVLIEVRACGACHTDLHLVEGDLPLQKSPLVPGHQIVGVIREVGAGVDAGRVGQRVGVPWLSSSCGGCRHCRAGRENLCREARYTGWHVDGGFAEHAVAPSAAAHPIPDCFGDAEASPLLCAGIIGYRSLRLSGIEPGGRLGLYGFGASAHLAIQVARHWGCEVYVSTRSEAHRRLARELGAVWTGGAEEDCPEPLDAAVTFAPVGWVVAEALRDLGRGGTVAVNAIHLDEIPALDYREQLYWEKTLRSVTNLTHRDAREFLELAAEVPVRTVVRSFPVEEANRALQMMAESKLEAAAAVVPGGDRGERGEPGEFGAATGTDPGLDDGAQEETS